MNSLKILKYSKNEKSGLAGKPLPLLQSVQERAEGIFVCACGSASGARRGSTPRRNTNTISQWKCECENAGSVFYLIFVQVPSVYKGR